MPGLCFVMDLDGTLLHGKVPSVGAREFIERAGDRFVVVSNNSTHSAHELVEELAAAGLDIPADKLILAGQMAIQLLVREYLGAQLLLIGSPSLRREAENSGLRLVEAGADIVLLGRDVTFTYQKLSLIANEIRRGAALLVTNPDTSHPGGNGTLIPETGALMNAVLACAKPAVMRVVGKPNPDLFHEALTRLGSSPQNCLVIGDNPDTDAAGALRVGMKYLLVGPDPHCDAPDLRALNDLLSGGANSAHLFPRNGRIRPEA